MNYYVNEWVTYLKTMDAVIAIPLCIAGLALVVAGWRLWTILSLAGFGLVGAVCGQLISGKTELVPLYAGVGALIFCLSGALIKQHSTIVLGAVAGGTIAGIGLDKAGINGIPQFLGALVGLVAAGAWAVVDRQQIKIVLSAFAGAVLLISGLSVVVAETPLVTWFFKAFYARQAIMVPFLIVVPTAIGIMVQLADLKHGAQKTAHP